MEAIALHILAMIGLLTASVAVGLGLGSVILWVVEHLPGTARDQEIRDLQRAVREAEHRLRLEHLDQIRELRSGLADADRKHRSELARVERELTSQIRTSTRLHV